MTFWRGLSKLLSNPIVFAAMIAGLITLNTTILSNRQLEIQRNLDEQKYESSLILSAIATGDPKVARDNLQFLLESGLLQDRGGRIEAALRRFGAPPQVPRGDQKKPALY
jgi:hypothetical protein